MAQVGLLVIFLVVVVGMPMLSRTLIRRMSGSEGLREFLNAYGPGFRVPRRDRDEPGDGPES